MAIYFHHGRWWFEWRTRRERVRKNTGFGLADKAKAQAVFEAFRLARDVKPKRSVVEGILEAIYADKPREDALALSSVWAVYDDWMQGKGKVLSRHALAYRRNSVARFVAWAEGRKCRTMDDVDVSVSRAYVASVRSAGRTNKTVRDLASMLSSVWEAVGQIRPGVHNPWKAAIPDKDGSSVSRSPFSVEEEARVLAAAKEVGHGWWLASTISRWTGLRYGDVARLDWSCIDLSARTIAVTPGKTARHGVSVLLPIADPLYDALCLTPPAKRSGAVLPDHCAAYPAMFSPPFSAVLAKAGLSSPSFTFHSWRHTFRTRLADAGVSDDAARRLGGWTNLGMAAHYDHSKHLPELRAAISAMQSV
jgi:integrase